MRRNESLLSYDAHMQTVLGDSFDYAAVKALPHLNMFLGWISTSEGVDALQVGSGGWARGGGGYTSCTISGSWVLCAPTPPSSWVRPSFLALALLRYVIGSCG